MIPEALRRRAPTSIRLLPRRAVPAPSAAAAAARRRGCEVTSRSCPAARRVRQSPARPSSRPTRCFWTRARRSRPPWSPRRLEFLPTVSCSSAPPSRPSAAACRAEVAAAFAHRACVRSWDADGGRPPASQGACPFAPKANTLGPAPGRSARSLAETFGTPPSGGGRRRGFRSRFFRRGLFIRRPALTLPTTPGRFSARASTPRERGCAVRVGRRRDGRALGPVLGRKSDPRGRCRSPSESRSRLRGSVVGRSRSRRRRRWMGSDREVTMRDSPRVARVPDPRWNVGVLAAFAARRRAAAAARRRRRGAGALRVRVQVPVRLRPTTQREANIQTSLARGVTVLIHRTLRRAGGEARDNVSCQFQSTLCRRRLHRFFFPSFPFSLTLFPRTPIV